MKLSRIMWGILFIIVGVIVGLNALNITDINIFFDGWWTLFIIVPAFIGLFERDDRTSSLIWLIVGVVLLLACNDVFTFEFIGKLILPVILVIIGLSIIFKNTTPRFNRATKDLNSSSSICATFREDVIHASNDDSITLEAIFGSITYILKDVEITKDVLIKANATFGSIKIIVPEGVNVKLKSNGVFCENSSKVKEKEGHTVYVDANSIFGGVKVYDN